MITAVGYLMKFYIQHFISHTIFFILAMVGDVSAVDPGVPCNENRFEEIPEKTFYCPVFQFKILHKAFP